jgi:broad specificity phosphatase PhoE
MPVLYYVRHGETDWNAEQRLQGHRDVVLNARGRDQAAHCGGVLHDLFARDECNASDIAYMSSPLKRARETMELMRVTLGLGAHPYDLDERLIEISFGDWEGLTLSEIVARAPEALAQRDLDKWGFTPPGGESYRALTSRVGAWYATIARDTVVAGHGGVARALIAHLGIMPVEDAPRADIAQGVVYVFANAAMTRYA